MITTKDTIGYIKKYYDDTGKEQFKFIESKIKKIVYGKIKNAIYSNDFYSLDLEDIECNTKLLINNNKIMLVGEPFITNPELSERCRKNVEYWNKYGTENNF